MSKGHASPPRWQWMLPPAWRGDSRAAAWRRSRGRRVASGVLVALAAVATIGAMRPAAEPTRAVIVAARDVPAGARLGAADVRTVHWPRSATFAASSAASLLGRTTVTPIGAGEPVTASRLRAADTLPRVPDGQVVISIPLADPTLTNALRVGDHVRAWSADDGGQPIGGRLRVVGVVAPQDSGDSLRSSSPGAPPAVLVAATAAVAGQLARALADGQSPGTAVLLAIAPAD